MKTKTTKAKSLLRLLRRKFNSWVKPEPGVVATHLQAESIVHLLRKRYSLHEQNEILLECGELLLTLREEDRRHLEAKLQDLNTETMSLASAMNMRVKHIGI